MSLSDRDVIDDAMNDAILSFIPQKTSKDQSFVTVNDKGQAYFYEVLDPYMADALQSLSPRQLGFFLRILSEIKRMMTMLTTGNNPIFGDFKYLARSSTGIYSRQLQQPIYLWKRGDEGSG